MRPTVSTPRVVGLISLCSLVGALAACDGNDAVASKDTSGETGPQDEPQLTRIETHVEPTNVVAGATAEITCSAFDQYDQPFTLIAGQAALVFEIVDPEGKVPTSVTVEGQIATFTRAGAYRATCKYPGTPLVTDASPTRIEVQAGAPASIKTTILDDDVVAGTTLGVACSVRDANGNSAAAETMIAVVPTDGVTVANRTAHFEKVGAFEVRCMTTDGSLVSDAPVTVTVTAADLYQMTTTLSTASIAVAEQVTVTCPGEDRFGNPVTVEKIVTLPADGVDGLDSNRLVLTSTKAGIYSIVCSPKEAWVKALSEPALLTVVAGPPASLTLDITPDRAVYNVEARVTATPKLADTYGNAISDLSAVRVEAWFGGTKRQTLAQGEKVALVEEGTWTVKAILGPPYNLKAERVLLADASAPVISITNPDRGEMVVATGSPITLQGSVKDSTGGLLSVTVNGAAQDIVAGTLNWPLSKSVLPAHGVNTVSVAATDTNEHSVRVVQSYLASSGYKAATEKFPDGIVAHLDKKFIDDGDRSGAANDLATIFERLVAGMDFSTFIPSPVITYSGFDVYLQNLAYDPPKVRMSPSNGGLLLMLDVTNMAVDVEADGFIDVGGHITVDSVNLEMMLHLSVTNGQANVTADAAVVRVNNLDIDVHWSINWIIDFFEDDISSTLSGMLEQQLKSQVPGLLRDALKSLEINQSFTVPAMVPGGQPLNVNLAAKLAEAHVDEKGLDLDLSTLVTAPKRVAWPTSGSIMRGGCFGTDNGMPGWNASKKMTMALSLDVLNQVLHAVWQGGALEITLGANDFQGVDLSAYGVSNLALTISARLPPVLTDCPESSKILFQLGELRLDATMDFNMMPLEMSVIATLQTDAIVEVDANGNLGVSLAAIADENITLDFTRIESEIFEDTTESEDALGGLLREQLLSKVLGELAGKSLANFPLPEFDLGAMSPALAGQKISLKNVVLAREKGYLKLEGSP